MTITAHITHTTQSEPVEVKVAPVRHADGNDWMVRSGRHIPTPFRVRIRGQWRAVKLDTSGFYVGRCRRFGIAVQISF